MLTSASLARRLSDDRVDVGRENGDGALVLPQGRHFVTKLQHLDLSSLGPVCFLGPAVDSELSWPAFPVHPDGAAGPGVVGQQLIRQSNGCEEIVMVEMVPLVEELLPHCHHHMPSKSPCTIKTSISI